ncbi:HAMP domain-containing sensor histidine kinase [Pelomonas sp. KK5]|uniref:sensor histidine kinase n=1 Tax=Pelomonas sp. KK5 TaxID=1855730 RepID=UPI00097C0FD7|nr:HAMP domain-containing sensor histidine kinase [Pelomonas sp. KK5]
MKSLYLRIYLTLVVLLLAFAFGSGWLFQRQMEQERGNYDAAATERLTAIAQLVYRVLPPETAPREQQAEVLLEWGQRLRMALALYDDHDKRIAANELFEKREEEPGARAVQVTFEDGRKLTVIRTPRPQGWNNMPAASGPMMPLAASDAQLTRVPFKPGMHRPQGAREESPWPFALISHRTGGEALAVVLVLLFLGVALGAYPVVRRLTRRLESLKRGVEQFGSGQLAHRVDDHGNDEVAALAVSFNRAADQIEALLRSNRTLLANASHELRSPLARLKMAFAMMDDASPAARARLGAEINTNIAELDALVEEVLLASRLEAGNPGASSKEAVDLVGLGAEEASRVDAAFEPADGLATLKVSGEDRLLRRALRNLLENARRYGGAEVRLEVKREGDRAEFRVCDRGPGVPEGMRERIFEAFFRLPGHAEQAGGVGLGLSLVKQIAQRHGGQVRCESREGGGSVFVFSVPAMA